MAPGTSLKENASEVQTRLIKDKIKLTKLLGELNMSKSAVIEKLEKQQLKRNIATLALGIPYECISALLKGDKERLQVFTGTVIARKGIGPFRNIFCPSRGLWRRDGAGIYVAQPTHRKN